MSEITDSFLSVFNQLPDSIIATVHKDPDFDAIGSLLAIKELGNHFNKDIDIVSLDIDIDQFLHLPNIDQLVTKPKNNYDLAIFLDCSDQNRIYNADEFPTFKESINIDHHQDNTHFGTYNYVSDKSSVGEMLVTLFKALNVPITQQIATNLYAAICFDTGNFKFSNTCADTMRAAAELIETGIKPHQISEWVFENKSIEYFDDVRVGLQNMHVDTNHPFMIITMPFNKNQSKESSINFFRQLKNIELIVICKEIAPNKIKLSFRSKHKINVAKLAKQFNGGGHIRAAGANYEGNINDIQLKLKNEIYEAFK